MSLKVRRFTPVWRDRDGNRMFAVMHRVETRRGAVNLASILSADMLVAGWSLDCVKEIVVDRQGKIHRCPNVEIEHARLGPIAMFDGPVFRLAMGVAKLDEELSIARDGGGHA